MNICKKCGSENEDYAKFCVSCGKSFNSSLKVNVEKQSLIEKIFYIYDEEESRYRIGKIKSFLVIEGIFFFIWSFYELFMFIPSARGDFFVSLIAAICIVIIFAVPSYVILIIIKKLYHFISRR